MGRRHGGKKGKKARERGPSGVTYTTYYLYACSLISVSTLICYMYSYIICYMLCYNAYANVLRFSV